MLSRLPFFCKADIRKSGGVDIPVRNRGRIWKSKETPKTNSREGLGIVLARPVRHPAQDVLYLHIVSRVNRILRLSLLVFTTAGRLPCWF